MKEGGDRNKRDGADRNPFGGEAVRGNRQVSPDVSSVTLTPLLRNTLDQALMAMIAASVMSPSAASSSKSPPPSLSSHLRRKYGLMASSSAAGDVGDQSENSECSSSTSAMLLETDAIWNSVKALVTAQVEVERQKHQDKLQRSLKRVRRRQIKAKATLETVRESNRQLIKKNDDLQRALEFEQQKNQQQEATQRRAAERNERLQKSVERLRKRLEIIEAEKVAWQRERGELTQQLQQHPHQHIAPPAASSLSMLTTNNDIIGYPSVYYVDDVQAFDLSTIVESPSASREEAQEFKESVLNAELNEATNKLLFEQKLLKMKNREMEQLETSFHRVATELEGMHENVQMKEEELFMLKQEVRRRQGSHQRLVEQNSRLEANVELLRCQLESEHSKMALQVAFTDSLKNQIYMGQEGQHKQAEEIIRLRQLVETQQRQSDERLIRLSQQFSQEEERRRSTGNEMPSEAGDSEVQGTQCNVVATNSGPPQELVALKQAYHRSQQEIRSLKDELERIVTENEIVLREAHEEKERFGEAALAEINRFAGIRGRLQRKNQKQKILIDELKRNVGVENNVSSEGSQKMNRSTVTVSYLPNQRSE